MIRNKNSTRTPLAANATFTGEWEPVGEFTTVTMALVSSSDGTLYLYLSVDGITEETPLQYTVNAGVNEVHRAIIFREYYRLVFVNGSSAQTYFRLQTKWGDFGLPSSPLNLPIGQDNDAIVARTISEELSIVKGFLSGHSIVNKFGTNADINSVPEDIWEGGGVYTGFPSSSLETLAVSSSDPADTGSGSGARTVRITGLDTNYDVISETVTLNGTTPVNTTQQFRRAHTMQVLTAGNGGVNAGTITATHSTTTSNVFLKILAGRNQSNCSAYTVPAGYTAFMRSLHVAIRGGQANAAVDGNIWTRSFGGVFRSRRPTIY